MGLGLRGSVLRVRIKLLRTELLLRSEFGVRVIVGG